MNKPFWMSTAFSNSSCSVLKASWSSTCSCSLFLFRFNQPMCSLFKVKNPRVVSSFPSILHRRSRSFLLHWCNPMWSLILQLAFPWENCHSCHSPFQAKCGELKWCSGWSPQLWKWVDLSLPSLFGAWVCSWSTICWHVPSEIQVSTVHLLGHPSLSSQWTSTCSRDTTSQPFLHSPERCSGAKCQMRTKAWSWSDLSLLVVFVPDWLPIPSSLHQCHHPWYPCRHEENHSVILWMLSQMMFNFSKGDLRLDLKACFHLFSCCFGWNRLVGCQLLVSYNFFCCSCSKKSCQRVLCVCMKIKGHAANLIKLLRWSTVAFRFTVNRWML